MNYRRIHVLFEAKLIALGGYLPSMPLLRGVKNVCLLTEEHVASVCHVLRNFRPRSSILHSETRVWALHLGIVILLVSAVGGLLVVA